MRCGRCSAARLADAPGHFARLERSLGELRIATPMSQRGAERGAARDRAPQPRRDGLVYLQVTRGVAARDHAFPNPPVPPSVVITAKPRRPRRQPRRAPTGRGGDHRAGEPLGRAATSRPSACCPTSWPSRRRARPARWRPGSSTISASSPRARPATPGSSTRRDACAPATSRPTSCAASPARPCSDHASREELGWPWRSGRSRVEEARAAQRSLHHGRRDACVLPVVSIDGASVGDGTPGPVAKRLRELYIDEARRTAA